MILTQTIKIEMSDDFFSQFEKEILRRPFNFENDLDFNYLIWHSDYFPITIKREPVFTEEG